MKKDALSILTERLYDIANDEEKVAMTKILNQNLGIDEDTLMVDIEQEEEDSYTIYWDEVVPYIK